MLSVLDKSGSSNTRGFLLFHTQMTTKLAINAEETIPSAIDKRVLDLIPDPPGE